MTYKWSLEYIDTLTWPIISDLLEAIKEHPPIDLMVAAMFKEKQTPVSPDKISSKIPAKRGKIGVIRKR